MSHHETMQLICRAQRGDEACVDTLVEENMALVHSVAKRFAGRGAEYDDLFQLGCVGLFKAIKRFDLRLSLRFSTYAVPMIAGEMRRFLRDDGAIRVGRGLKEKYREAMKVKEALTARLGREPDIRTWAQEQGLSPAELVYILDSGKAPVSLDAPVDAGGDAKAVLGDLIASDSENPAKSVDRIMLKQMLAELAGRERMIIVMRFFQQKSQREIAEKLGISQVQVSRLEHKILHQMREKWAGEP
ncbi:MAG: SigB/SigF/SigG family RNA polymerase sigma factor [Christensenellales bacterium]